MKVHKTFRRRPRIFWTSYVRSVYVFLQGETNFRTKAWPSFQYFLVFCSIFDETVRSSCWQMRKIFVFKNLTNFSKKHQCQSLFFNKVAGLLPATLLRKRLRTGVFLLILQNFLRTSFCRTPPSKYWKAMKQRKRPVQYRSSHSKMLFKIGHLKNFAIFTGRDLCWISF